MKMLRALGVLLTTLCLSAGLVVAAPTPEEAAQKAVEDWLLLVDAGKYTESWSAAAPTFQSAITSEAWAKALEAARKPLGALVKRKFKSAQATKTLPGAPDGDYVILQFETEFANKKAAIETTVPMLDKEGKWKVSGYFIK